jgi:hypothetical protein
LEKPLDEIIWVAFPIWTLVQRQRIHTLSDLQALRSTAAQVSFALQVLNLKATAPKPTMRMVGSVRFKMSGHHLDYHRGEQIY